MSKGEQSREEKGEVRVTLRIPEDLYTELKQYADERFRSTHNQILAFIKAGLERAKRGEREDERETELAAAA